MTDPTPERIAAALALAEHSDMISEFFLREMRAKGMGAVVDAVHAYRATKPKLRSRAEVDAEIVERVRFAERAVPAGSMLWDELLRRDLQKLCREETRDSGPSRADAADGGPPPAVPVSPAGADLLQRLELVERYIGPSALAWARTRMPSGPPGAAAAKESSDTTAAAPEGAALDGVEKCGCEQSESLLQRIAWHQERSDELQRRVDRQAESLVGHRRLLDAVYDLAKQIVAILEPTQA